MGRNPTSTVPPFSFEKTEVGKQEPTGKHPDLGGPKRGKVKKVLVFKAKLKGPPTERVLDCGGGGVPGERYREG